MHDAVAHIISQKDHLFPGKLKVTEFFFEVPTDYGAVHKGTTRLFARTVVKNERPAADQLERDSNSKQLPWFLYLQGGPGFGCAPPQHNPLTEAVLTRGYQLVYLDQRGTGLSSPITAETLALHGDAEHQADYLKLFRADNIVRDCEAVRKALTTGYPEHLKKWSVLGQSFGGFCTLTYLSKWPQGLREVFTTGGLAPIGHTPDSVYKATYQKVIDRNKSYYLKYPEDVVAVHEIVLHIKSRGGLELPSGALLTVRLFLTLGRNFGFHGGLDTVHDLILRTRADLMEFQFITRPTLAELDAALTFENNVIYAVLHEAIYCQSEASNWSAERVGKSIPEYQWLEGYPDNPNEIRDRPLYFAGEMIYQFMFEVFPELNKLAKVAKIVAEFSDWPELYDQWQLANNSVPLYSLTYIDDIYVDFELALGTVNKIRNCRHAITNGLHHDAIRSKSLEALKLLFALRDDETD